jgi:hypothetical protein
MKSEPMTRAEMNEGWVRATTKLERGSLEWRAVHEMYGRLRAMENITADLLIALDAATAKPKPMSMVDRYLAAARNG